jgi:hypothetical protein
MPAANLEIAMTPLAHLEHSTSESIEGRSAARRPASQVPSITSIRLSPHGADATLVNISASGVLVESTSRIRLATPVTIGFDGTFLPSSVAGRVTRISVATIGKNGVLRYHIGIAFNDPTVLADALAPANLPPESAPHPLAMLAPAASPAVLVNRW